MNILYLFGNGFDLNLGLKTSYQQFYNYYLEQDSPSESVSILKECIKKERHLKLWSDLELALGQVASTKYTRIADFEEAIMDISQHLRTYIQTQNTYIIPTEDAQQKMKQSICNPIQYLNPSEQRTLESFLSQWSRETWTVDIITFNYTDSISQILATKANTKIGSHGPYNILFNDIHHIHGKHDDTILVGVDNVEQIANETFRNNVDFTDIFVKPQSNSVIGTLIDRRCQSLIQNANLIVLYGLSLGETDHTWKQHICNRISGPCRIILFTYNDDEKYKKQIAHQRNLMGRYKRVEQRKLIDSDNHTLLDKIHVGINTDIFDFEGSVVSEPFAV